MGVISGKEYKKRMNKLGANVWVDGKKVEGDLSKHPIFMGIIESQASLYDLQHSGTEKEKMTYLCAKTGEKISMSFLQPKTVDDLRKRRYMIQQWARKSVGMLGRSPDYMNTALTAFASSAGLFGQHNKQYMDHLICFYDYVRQNDLTLTHTFINPQTNRSSSYSESKDEKVIAAKIVGETKDGMIIRGARLLATQGGITDEIMVFPSGDCAKDEDYAYAFSIPCNWPGVKFICRQPFTTGASSFDSPLGSRFEENDAIVVFEDVEVPWDRVFCYKDSILACRLYSESSFFPLVAHQVTSRQVVKVEFILGLIQAMIDTIGIGEYEHIKNKVSEIIIGLETMKALLKTSELEGEIDTWGTYRPSVKPLLVAANTFPTIYPRITEIVQQVGASGLVTIPTEADISSELREDVKHYLQADQVDGVERTKLFRLAWDLSMSSFGTRQTLYERFFFGDPIRLSSNLYENYERKSYVEWVWEYIKGL